MTKLRTLANTLVVGGLLLLGGCENAFAKNVESTLDNSDLQRQVERMLWGCYLVGADYVGAGDVAAAKRTLRGCFTSDMVWETTMPPAYAALNFKTTGGADGFVDTAHQIYTTSRFVRVHHLITNIVVTRVSADRLKVTSSAQAVHVYADERAFSAIVVFTDAVVRKDGVWKIQHRDMNGVAANHLAAWVP